MSRGLKVFLAVAAAVAVLALAGGLMMFAGGASGGADGEPVTVVVPAGVSAGEVADLLAGEGVIRSAFVFRLTARFDDRANRIKSGTYELETGMSNGEVLEILAQGPPPPPTFRVTIPEGFTVAQTLERIANATDSPFTSEELERALEAVALPAWVPTDLPDGAEPFEGVLFPSTYEFRLDTDAQQVLGRLVDQTERILAGVVPPAGYNVYNVLTIASLIEREARVPDEQPIIASVIYNRLARPMRLQIDATVQYARGEHTERLLFRDTRVDSRWNTYEYDGLPPTPIAAPGEAAIRAAAEPAQTEFLYYVVCDTSTGRHAFARTLDEHNANVAQFRQIRDTGGSFC